MESESDIICGNNDNVITWQIPFFVDWLSAWYNELSKSSHIDVPVPFFIGEIQLSQLAASIWPIFLCYQNAAYHNYMKVTDDRKQFPNTAH